MTGRHDTQRLTLTDRTKLAVQGPNVVPAAIAGFLLCMLIGGFVLIRGAHVRMPKSVAAPADASVEVTPAVAAIYSNVRRYGGTLEPWARATIGPKALSAYVATVMVRPGDNIIRGDVIATLDCRNALALLPGHVSADGAPPQRAVGDCTFRAPFDGEVATRLADPGTFVGPGSTILTLLDRSTIRVVFDVPETDFAELKPGTLVSVRSLIANTTREARVSRRAPTVDATTHKVTIEVDLTDDDRNLPLGTAVEITTTRGDPISATEIPSSAAKLRGDIATLMVLDGDVVSRLRVKALGERDGKLYVESSLAPGTRVVLEGERRLHDGDHVTVRDNVKP